MKKRILAFLLAFMMVLPFIMPVKSSADKLKSYQENNSQVTRIKLGNLDVDKYPKIDRKTILAINKQKRDEINGKKMERGVQPFSLPWFPNQREPGNDEKSKLFGRIHVDFQLEGLKEGGTSKPFDWAGVFSKDEDGNQKYATIVFEQYDYKTGERTGITNTMQVNNQGKFTWSGEDGPSELPLYNRDTFEPYGYEVYLVQEKSKHIQLLTTGTLSTAGGTTFQKPDANGKILANVTLTIGLEQVSSTKFVSEWNTDVKEEDRPKIGGLFNTHKQDKEGLDIEGIFVFPRNNSEEKIIRDFNRDPDAEYDEMKDDIFPSWDLRNVATVSVDEPFTPRTDDYIRNEDDKTIVFTKGDRTYKYKYDFTYDVINGGKLTMTEIIPITFNANGGEFENFEAPDTASEVKKEVEYKKDLTTLPDEPTWSMHTFKGWSETADGKTPVDEKVFKTITEPKTYYAIWDELVDFSVEKTWKNSTDLTLNDNDYPTMKFTLYRKVEGGNDEKVADAEEKEITKLVTEAKWENLPKSDKNGKEYTYFVKESFKDSDVKNDNWKLGDFTSTNNAGTLVNTITNELVKPSGELKVKKVLENEVNKAQEQMRMMRSASLPIKFKFKVTGPYGYENEFDLAAGETKTLTDLVYGDYVVTETDSRGYTPDYSKEKETLTKDSPKGSITVTNKNLQSTGNNENIITKSVTKVWVGGEKPSTTIELWRKGYDGSGQEFEQKVNEFTTVANGNDIQTKAFDSLAKHDSTGREFTYYAKEAKVPAGYTATYSDDKLTITNSMNIIKDDTPGTDDDKPVGYVTVRFLAGNNGSLSGDTKYYVNPNADPIKTMADIKEPSIKANTGYSVANIKWKDENDAPLDKATEIKTDLTYTAQYELLGDIIKDPTPEDKTDKPEDYVTVTFKAGDHGKIDDSSKDVVYYVNPKADPIKVMGDITQPSITANQGYKVADTKWKDAENNGLDTATQIDKDLTYTAQYDKEKDIISSIAPDTQKPNDKPDGYVTVRFLTNKNGELTGETTYYVNPKAEKTMKDITAPKITANDGYKVGNPKWKPDFSKDTSEIKEDRNYVANYDSLCKAEINYISIDTNMGTVSSPSEKILENQDITGSTAKANPGYKFVKWTDVTGKPVSTDAKFVPANKESATYIAVFEKEDSIAEKVKKLFDLEGVDLAAFVGDSLADDFWKDGIKSREKSTSPFTEDEKAAIKDALENASVTDTSDRNTDQEILRPSIGTLKIDFKDGSSLTVKQRLYVYANGADIPGEDKPTPKDSVKVIYKAGANVKAFAEKQVLVKKGTKEGNLPERPDASPNSGYKDLKWTASPAIDKAYGIQIDTVLTASAAPELRPDPTPTPTPEPTPDSKPTPNPEPTPDSKPTPDNKKEDEKEFNPKTGVFTNIELYLGLMSASALGLYFTRNKKED